MIIPVRCFSCGKPIGHLWEDYKKRLNPTDPRRYPKNWDKEETYNFFEASSQPVVLVLAGFFGFGSEVMGRVPFSTAFYSNPELVEDIIQYYTYFVTETLKECVETLKNKIDFIYLWEDLAYKHGPHISPKLFQRYLLKKYIQITSFFKKNNIETILLDSDGNLNPILPLLIKGGINGVWPLEVAAGMNAITLRRKYGEKLFLMGNIDKQILTKDKKSIKKEIDSKIPILKEMGGYIPGLDHDVPPNIPWKNFEYYVKYLKQML